MYFNFDCPHCGKKLRGQEEQTGRSVRCPFCKNSLTVPEVASPEPQPAAGPEFVAQPGAGTNRSAVPASTAPVPAGSSGGVRPGVTLTAGVTTAAKKSGRSTRGRAPKAASNDDGTNVSLVWTAAVGLLFTALFYAILTPVPKVYFRDLFFDRGWVTIAETFFMFWAVAILIAKSRKLIRQRESMLFDLLPESISKDISLRNVTQFSEYVRGLPVDTRASFLTRRVVRGLEHYGVRGSVPEVSTMLSSQSELDNNAVASSYSLLNVFIWAIPILGFIGTVQGLGSAVGNLSGSLEAAADVDSIKKSLGAITGGLGVAFDTTLVALIMSLFLKFPASSLQKAEEDLLNWVEDYCNENLLKRLIDESVEPPAASTDATLQKAINAALVPHQAELRAWTASLREIGAHLTDDVARGWTQVHQDLEVRHSERIGELHAALQKVGEVAAQMSAVTQQLSQSQLEQAACAAQVTERQSATLEVGQQQVTSAVERSSQLLDEQLSLLRQAVINLNETLGQLNGKQVVIEVQPPAKRGWFGRRS